MKKTSKKKQRSESSETVDTQAHENESASPETVVGSEAGTPAAEPTAEDWHDRYLRLAAEFDNFRKRSAREFASVVRNAERDLMVDLTEAIDNLGRALDGDHKGESVDDFAKGVGLIRDQLWKTLEDRGLERMTTVGTAFDPDSHDALMQSPSDEHDEGVIIQEIAPGYLLKGEVVRHARVIVSQGKGDTEESE